MGTLSRYPIYLKLYIAFFLIIWIYFEGCPEENLEKKFYQESVTTTLLIHTARLFLPI